jgi:hypothetical protein
MLYLVRLLFLSSVGLLFLSRVFQAVAADPPDLLVADFERDKFGDWSATGEAFGPGPGGGAVPG